MRRHLAEKFDAYLREGWLSIETVAGLGRFQVTPPRLLLPRLLADVGVLTLPRDPAKRLRLELYFDPSGKGRVLIRHHGVTVVDDLSATSAHGLEDSMDRWRTAVSWRASWRQTHSIPTAFKPGGQPRGDCHAPRS